VDAERAGRDQQDGVSEKPGVQENEAQLAVGFFKLSATAEDTAIGVSNRVHFLKA
jgi:hypothetical protein